MIENSGNIRVVRIVDNRIRLTCKKCLKTFQVNMNELPHLLNKLIIKYKCRCGYVGRAKIEKRASFRKPMRLTGELKKDGTIIGLASINDLSKSGLKFEFNSRSTLKVGDNLELEFRLDDKKRSFIRQKGIIRNSNNFQYGLEFIKGEYNKYDRRLGFYFL